ncbi:MAG: GspH/FimT family pseudopilin [Gammaproteobacteria bacterium]|nr:GspH/FimT family pseudopilin [Gammaproteobacteria bacterium]MCW5582305.1 GspH/FimT family pseudopilin [Gammaproteobacteria bacterium]
MKSEHAFTLIEMLITLFVIAILAATAFPALQLFWDRTQDQILQSELLHAIKLAKFEAFARRMPVAICQSKNQQTCIGDWSDGQIVFVNESADGVVNHKESILAVVKATSHHGQLYWRSFPNYRQYVLFLPTGSMRSDNGTFWHCHGELVRWAMMLSKSGRIRLVYPDKDGVIKDSSGKSLSCT